MGFGRITTEPCVTTPPPPDSRCDDTIFRLSNPIICPEEPHIEIKPAFALSCALGSVKFKVSFFEGGIEKDVTDQAVFQSSDPNVAVVGASSGNATGLSQGTVAISAAYNGMTAFADLTILGGDCCASQNVAMMLLVDKTKSMSQPFNGSYASKLAFAKAAARRFISEINETKDSIGLMSFTAIGNTVHSAPVSDKASVEALVDNIVQSQQLTTFYDALVEAIAQLNAVDADLRVLVIMSDFQDTDDTYSDGNNPVELLENFKNAGGLVMCLGVRAHDFGYNLANEFATGGFFINAHDAVAEASLDYMSGLKGYICAGNCAPTGDTFEPTGKLNYCGFQNWDVIDGHVDLIGSGFMDLLPGNGLYVDLAGSTPDYRGTMLLKEALTVEAGKNYRLRLTLAGNQRVNATPNALRAKVFTRNTDGVVDPALNPSCTLNGSDASVPQELYEYAVSYRNANGETQLSGPVLQENGEYSDCVITVEADPRPTATVARFWKREYGTEKWYLIAESDATNPQIQDTYNNATLAAAIANGTIDACVQPSDTNTTGTPIVFLDQSITINNFQQDFQEFAFSFNATQDADVWISLQQIDTPAGYPSTGLLLAKVVFEDATDLTTLFEDDFDTENISYVAPACGVGTNYVLLDEGGYGYLSGYNCYGAGCLSEPPDVQTQDPNPIADNETGFKPPTEYTSTKAVCKNCDAGFLNLGPNLVPTMTSNTAPSGVASASSNNDGSVIITQSFNAFDKTTSSWISQDPADAEEWIQYQFTAAKTVRVYGVTNFKLQYSPRDFALQGSNDGSTWTTLHERENETWAVGQNKRWLIAVPGAYKYYRLLITDVNYVPTEPQSVAIREFELFEVPGQVCKTATEISTVSQADADNKATATATAAALAELNCVAVYNATDSYTSHCPLGQYGEATRGASYTSLISQQDANDNAHALAVEAAETARDCTQSNNTQAIKIGHGIGSALPYPSVLHISGYDDLAAISKINLKLKKVASNVNLLRYVTGVLMSPSGTMVNFFRAVTHNCAVPIELVSVAAFPLSSKRVNSITFDDDATDPFPVCPVGPSAELHEDQDYSFQPTVEGSSFDLPAPLPPGPYTNVNLSAFNGENPNGSWSLWFAVITEGYYGAEISQGWELEITAA